MKLKFENPITVLTNNGKYYEKFMEHIVPSYTFFLFLPRSYAFSVSPILSPPSSHTRSLSSSIAYAFSLTFPLLTICYTYRSRFPHCILCFTHSFSLHRICVLSYVPFTYDLLYLPFSLLPLRSLFIHLICVLPLFLHRIRVLSYVPFIYHLLYLPFSFPPLRSLLWHARRHNQLTCKDKAGEKK